MNDQSQHSETAAPAASQTAKNDTSAAATKSDTSAPVKKKPLWPWLIGGVVIIGFMVIVLVIIWYPNPNAKTDDATVTAHYSTVAPRVTGQVTSVAVRDNQLVHAGDLLATIDDRNYVIAVEKAKAQLAHDRDEVTNSAASIARQPSVIGQNDAQVAQVEPRVVLARQNAERYRNLADAGSGSRQDQQQAEATLREQQADLAAAQAAAHGARRQSDILKAQQAAAEATVQADEADLKQANLNLGYTRIVAPVDGMVGELSVHTGNYVSAGSSLLVVVPLQGVYVEAQYREVALRHMLAGQRVKIHVDAYDIDLDGVVDSIPPASGSVFAAIAPDNATGNYTKIVQRLPVKIDFVPGQPDVSLLRLGMSVETTVRTGLADVAGRARASSAPVSSLAAASN
ncbi:MAG: HlyD family secretion protein [Janthinobacterium lividum]